MIISERVTNPTIAAITTWSGVELKNEPTTQTAEHDPVVANVLSTFSVKESDCLVYMVESPAGIGVRSLPTGEEKLKTGRSFNHKDLVSVDFVESVSCGLRWCPSTPLTIIKSREMESGLASTGPFLRLSDDSGWLFETKNGRKLLRLVPVQDGLWTFYVHNPPHGQFLRWHPVHRDEFRIRRDEQQQIEHLSGVSDEYVTLWPTQKIYCDKKIVHPVSGVTFYRVQGTRGWVFDRKPGHRTPFLLDEHQVRKGLMAYQNLKEAPLEIRAWATIDDNARTGHLINPTDIVLVDMVIDETHPMNTEVNGPFLHLSDGRGWLFQNKGDSKDILTRLAIEQGYWAFKVVQEAGVTLRSTLTMDGWKGKQNAPLFACHSLVKCDRKITSALGNCFYRVIDTQGWIADKQNGMPAIELIHSSSFSPTSERAHMISSKDRWDPNFVRGIAAVAVEGGLEELEFDEANRLLRFSYPAGIILNIFYSTKTVGIETASSANGKIQVFRKNCTAALLFDIMKDPREFAEEGLQRRARDGARYTILNTAAGSGFVIEEEEEVRSNLIYSRLEIRSLKQKQARMLQNLKDFEHQSIIQARKIKDETDRLRKRVAEVRVKSESQSFSQSQLVLASKAQLFIASKSQSSSQSQLVIASKSNLQFSTVAAPPSPSKPKKLEQSVSAPNSPIKVRMLHQAAQEKFVCQVCRRVFQNAHYLNHHRRDIHGLECNHCFKIFSTMQLLKKHREIENHW